MTFVGDGRDRCREALEAADELASGGIATDVVCLTSADLVFRALQARRGLADGTDGDPRRALPGGPHLADRERAGRPSAHALIPVRRSAAPAIIPRRVSDFGQSGDVQDLYRYFGIDTDTIVGAAIDLID